MTLVDVKRKLLIICCSMLQALLQMVLSHDGSVKAVVEKGDALLSSVHYPSIRDKMNKLQKDYSDLCKTAMVGYHGYVMSLSLNLMVVVINPLTYYITGPCRESGSPSKRAGSLPQ